MNTSFKKLYMLFILIIGIFSFYTTSAQFEINEESIIAETITVDYLGTDGDDFISVDLQTTYSGFDIQFCLVPDGQIVTDNCFFEIPWIATSSYNVSLPQGTTISPPIINDGTFNYHTLSIRRLNLATGTSEFVTSYPLANFLTVPNLPSNSIINFDLSYDQNSGQNPTLSGLIPTDADYYFNIYLNPTDGGDLVRATGPGDIPWNANTQFSLALGSFIVSENDQVLSSTGNPDNTYNQIRITATHETTNEETEILHTFQVADLISGGTITDDTGGGGNGGVQTSGFLIDFPGWEIAEFRAINENGLDGFYPVLKSNGELTRTEPEALYLILQNLSTLERTVLDVYASGPENSFPITWPNPCDNLRPHCGMPMQSNLSPGLTYAVYLSDNPQGITVITTGESESTYVSFQVPPEEDLVTITQVENIDNSYFRVIGSFNGLVPTDILFRASQDSQPNNDVLFLGVQTLEPGSFVFPDASITQTIEPSEAYTIRAFYNEEAIAQYNLNGDGSGTTVVINNDGNSTNSGANNQTADDVIKNGIVVTDCGYDIGKNGKGRMCGFADLITLIGRVIEYIFILIIPIAAIVFAYAGFLYLTSGGDPGKKTAAKKAMTNVVIGIVIVMAAWLVVRTIVVSLGVAPGASWFFL